MRRGTLIAALFGEMAILVAGAVGLPEHWQSGFQLAMWIVLLLTAVGGGMLWPSNEGNA